MNANGPGSSRSASQSSTENRECASEGSLRAHREFGELNARGNLRFAKLKPYKDKPKLGTVRK